MCLVVYEVLFDYYVVYDVFVFIGVWVVVDVFEVFYQECELFVVVFDGKSEGCLIVLFEYVEVLVVEEDDGVIVQVVDCECCVFWEGYFGFVGYQFVFCVELFEGQWLR